MFTIGMGTKSGLNVCHPHKSELGFLKWPLLCGLANTVPRIRYMWILFVEEFVDADNDLIVRCFLPFLTAF